MRTYLKKVLPLSLTLGGILMPISCVQEVSAKIMNIMKCNFKKITLKVNDCELTQRYHKRLSCRII